MIEPKAWLYEDTSPLGPSKEISFDRLVEYRGIWTETALYPQSAIDALQAEIERLRAALKAAIEALRDDTGLDDGICCSGYHCGCRGSTNREVLLYELHQALEASHER